jgi:O-antigen/teichoic acid export membrane protein
LWISTFFTTVGSIVFVLLSEHFVPEFHGILTDPLAGVLIVGWFFIIFSSSRNIAKLIDGVFIAQKTSKYTLARTFSFDITKLGLMFIVLPIFGAIGAYVAWGGATLLSIVVGFILIGLKVNFKEDEKDKISFLKNKELFQFSLSNLVAWNFPLIMGSFLPIMVLALLGPAESAVFFFAWMLGSYAMIVPTAFSRNLLVESVSDKTKVQKYLKDTIGASLFILIPVSLVALFFGEFIFGLFGKSYINGSFLFFLFTLSAVLEIFIRNYFTIMNIRRYNKPLIILNALRFVIVIILSYFFGGMFGVIGFGYAWLLTTAIIAFIAIVKLLEYFPVGKTGRWEK